MRKSAGKIGEFKGLHEKTPDLAESKSVFTEHIRSNNVMPRQILIGQRNECVGDLTGLYPLVFGRNNQVEHRIEEHSYFFAEPELPAIAEQERGLRCYKTIEM